MAQLNLRSNTWRPVWVVVAFGMMAAAPGGCSSGGPQILNPLPDDPVDTSMAPTADPNRPGDIAIGAPPDTTTNSGDVGRPTNQGTAGSSATLPEAKAGVAGILTPGAAAHPGNAGPVGGSFGLGVGGAVASGGRLSGAANAGSAGKGAAGSGGPPASSGSSTGAVGHAGANAAGGSGGHKSDGGSSGFGGANSASGGRSSGGTSGSEGLGGQSGVGGRSSPDAGGTGGNLSSGGRRGWWW